MFPKPLAQITNGENFICYLETATRPITARLAIQYVRMRNSKPRPAIARSIYYCLRACTMAESSRASCLRQKFVKPKKDASCYRGKWNLRGCLSMTIATALTVLMQIITPSQLVVTN